MTCRSDGLHRVLDHVISRLKAHFQQNGILMDMPEPEPFRFQTRIRFIDTDTSGRIHYTAMFRYFESAEIEFMRSCGIHYITNDFALPRVHVECDFLLAILYDDLIEIEVCLTKLGRSSIRLEMRAFKGRDIAARGVIVIACMDKQTQRAISLPSELRERLAGRVTERHGSRQPEALESREF